MVENMFEDQIARMKYYQERMAETREAILHDLESYVGEGITFRRKYLYCPMCLHKIEIRLPGGIDWYTCPECGAWFELFDYGDKFEVKPKNDS